ncbi:hypothetical protein Tco_1432080, partial [Tanacetum coccineum]
MDVVTSFAGLTAATMAAAFYGLFACIMVRLMMQPGVKVLEVLVQTNEHTLLGFFRGCDVPTVSQRLAVERISKKRTKNEAKTTKPDTE